MVRAQRTRVPHDPRMLAPDESEPDRVVWLRGDVGQVHLDEL